MERKKVPFDTHKIKNYFVTGLVILLPVTLTLLIVGFFLNMLTSPFVGAVTTLIGSLGIFNGGFLFLSEDQLILYTSRLLIVVFLFFLTIFLGYIARYFFINWLIKIGEAILSRIPFIRSVYKTSQDVIQTIFTTQTKSFKQPVLVPYPNKDSWCLGLITRENITELTVEGIEEPVSVFIPTTPNPTSGYLLLFQRKDVIFLDMTIENALKYVISCGVIMTPIKPQTEEVEETAEES